MQQDWKIQKPVGTCFDSGRKLEEGEVFYSAIFLREGEFERRDYSEESWIARFGPEDEHAEADSQAEASESAEAAEPAESKPAEAKPAAEPQAEAGEDEDASEDGAEPEADGGDGDIEVDTVEIELPYSFWRTKMPGRDEPVRIPFVAAEEFFWQLAETPPRQRHRDAAHRLLFPLALLLLRKKTVTLASSVRKRGREILTFEDKEGKRRVDIPDPQLEAEDIAELELEIRRLLFPHLVPPDPPAAEPEPSAEDASTDEESAGETSTGESSGAEEAASAKEGSAEEASEVRAAGDVDG